MNLSDLLPPERVREIANELETAGDVVTYWEQVLVPEIARAVLELAAKRFDEQRMAAIKVADREAHHTAYDCADVLRQMAKEFDDAK